MKTLYKSVLAGCIILSPLFTNAQSKDWCLSEILFQKKAQSDPTLLQKREQLERETEAYIASHPYQRTAGTASKIIPVVFHVIHEGGSENISKAQILSQMVVLNNDYRRLNADTTNTPQPFKILGADCDIEFRLAQLDPNGNCTDGITHTFSHLTNDARDNVKALVYWPSDKYLNIWVVKTIDPQGVTGTVLGYAQFPGGGSATTDGLVFKFDCVGTVGAINANFSDGGRTATHEIGHWFNLRHIWGDDSGLCTGTDFVTDTPNQADKNFSTCPSFPEFDACTPSGNGVLFPDYMDYTTGTCKNIFTLGQAARMDAALNSSISDRDSLWTESNLIATGTNDGFIPVACMPIADFNTDIKYVCEGTTINFVDHTWQGDPTTWSWSFPGGIPSSSPDQNPAVQYNTAGTYDVTLTVTNATGNNTQIATGSVVVSASAGTVTAYPFSEGFESISVPGNDWFVVNESGNGWQQVTSASHTGNTCMKLTNFPSNVQDSPDGFITTSFNLSNVSATKMIFWRAFAYRSNSSTDKLSVLVSTDCGRLWSSRYFKTGTALGTAGLLSTDFTPTSTQWDADTVNLASTSVSGRPNVRFKFEYEQNSGNNIYIDDINLDGILGINEQFAESVNFEVYPNPAHTKAHVSFNLADKSNVELKIYDVTGREVETLDEKNLAPGDYQFDVNGNLDNGVYYVRLTIGNNSSVKKLVLN